MTGRPEPLGRFLAAARRAFEAHAGESSRESLGRIFGALERPARPGGSEPGHRDVCRHLATASDPGRFSDPLLRDLAESFLVLDPMLTWRPRGGAAPAASPSFADGHANAMVTGPAGLEDRQDAWIGASLLAPDVRYPDHRHAPEETYLVMTEGEFSQDGGAWFSPGIGGSFYNPPGILHAMRSGSGPLLAFWALWQDG